MIKLRRYLAYYKKECIIGPLCKLFEAILELLVPLVMAGIIDNGVRNGDTAYIWRMGGLLVILATVGLCSALVCQYLASKASQGVGTRLRRDLFLHINRLSHAELDKLGTPSLITRITYDTNQVQQSVAMAIRLLTRAPFIVIGSMVMAMTINLEMSIIFFIAAILIAVTLYLIMTKSIPIFEKMQKKSFQIECQFFHDRFWPASAVKIRGKWMRIDIRQAECLCNILAGIPCAFDAHLLRRGVAAAMPSPQGGGIARGRCMISSEAGLAPSGFPAAQFHNAAASHHHNIEQTPDGKPPGVRSIERRI